MNCFELLQFLIKCVYYAVDIEYIGNNDEISVRVYACVPVLGGRNEASRNLYIKWDGIDNICYNYKLLSCSTC
jgi:hypothetical protein